MKYFVLGALASGMLLYGMSMIYGATGTLEVTELAQLIAEGSAIIGSVLVFGLVFVVAGLGFELGVVPFHMWVPDVYHGAPSAVTLFVEQRAQDRRLRAHHAAARAGARRRCARSSSGSRC